MDLRVGFNPTTPAPAEPVILLQAEQFEAGELRIIWRHSAFATAYRVLISSDRTQTRLVQSFDPGEYWIQIVASNPQGNSNSAMHHLIISEAQNVLPGIFADGFE